jgi:hypothetical protein
MPPVTLRLDSDDFEKVTFQKEFSAWFQIINGSC